MRKLRKLASSPEFIILISKFNQAMEDSRAMLQDMFDLLRELDNDVQSYTSELAAQSIHES